MGRNSKSLSLALVLIMFMSSITIAETVKAQSTKPSPPKFSIQVRTNTLHTSPTSNGTTAYAVDLVVENQAFVNNSSVNTMVYFCKVKDHYSNAWGLDGNYVRQSSSKTTNITVAPFTMWPIMNSTILDFQVQAQTGYYDVKTVPGPVFKNGPGTSHLEYTFTKSQESDWSPTQTVDLTTGAVTPTSTFAAPELSWIVVLPLIALGIAAAAIVQSRKKSRNFDLG